MLTYSASYTVDVTYRCAKRCGYCEYRTDEGGLVDWATIDAQLEEAARLGGREVLIMSGEQPWLLPDLDLRDEAVFVDRVIEICRRAMSRGLLPHVNVGLLTYGSLQRLKPWSPSMGLMLESGTDELRAHANGGGKRVADRLRHIEGAGLLHIPFTTGILIGIGESRLDRERALRMIAEVQQRHGHVQEVIVQNFVPKPATPMQDLPGATLDDMVDTVRMAREILPESIAIQVPPNLVEDGWLSLVQAGARDLGGVSANGDSVSPSLPWEPVQRMREKAESIGFMLHPRISP